MTKVVKHYALSNMMEKRCSYQDETETQEGISTVQDFTFTSDVHYAQIWNEK